MKRSTTGVVFLPATLKLKSGAQQLDVGRHDSVLWSYMGLHGECYVHKTLSRKRRRNQCEMPQLSLMYVGMHSTAILSEKNTGEFTTSIDLAQCTYLSPSPDIAKPNPAQQTAIRSSTSRAPLVLRRLAPLTAIRKSRANSASAEIAQPIPPQQLPRRQRQSRIPHHRRSPRPFRSQTALKGPEGSNDQLRYRQNCFGGLRPVFLAGCDLQFKNQTHWFAFCEVIQSPFFKAYGGGDQNM